MLYQPNVRYYFSKTTTDEEKHDIHQMVYNFLKQQDLSHTQIKCSESCGPISEIVEEITISSPTFV